MTQSKNISIAETSQSIPTLAQDNALTERYRTLKAENSNLRIRDIATRLGVSEAKLVATELDDNSFQLHSDPRPILVGLPSVGEVMCLCRNDAVVHERYGIFENVRVHGQVGLVLGKDIDLRLFFNEWAYAFYLTQELASGTRESFQFFDAAGNAALKIYATDNTQLDNFRALARGHHIVENSIAPSPYPVQKSEPQKVDIETLRQAWSNMRDTHEFHGLLQDMKLDRLAALQQVGRDYAEQLPLDCISKMLIGAAEQQVPIMAFVNNRACIQIHSGPISQIKNMGKWLNILDPHFNLHLDTEQLTSTWCVSKPSDDGVITSLEVFDKDNQLCVQFFGARKPGIPERADWLELLSGLTAEPLQ
jgi:putative hemin transport protein